MATGLNRVVEHLQRTLLPTGLADGELLSRFVAAHDEPSFTTLVRRHGPMVCGSQHTNPKHQRKSAKMFFCQPVASRITKCLSGIPIG